jgi:hypothetical protein
MADSAHFQVDGLVRKAYDRDRANQHRRRNLRIAVRQLERAELYIVALYSLDLDDKGVEDTVDEPLQGLRGLQRYLLEAKLST